MADRNDGIAYKIALEAVRRYKNGVPFVIGVTGAGGSGKTTFADNLALLLGNDAAHAIDLDDYLISRRKRKELGIPTGYDPRANRLEQARSDLEALKARHSIEKPRYDHGSGEELSPERVGPRGVIIVEGVTCLYPELERVVDFSLYFDASPEVQLAWRLSRDVQERGYTPEEVRKALFPALMEHHQKFIEPTKPRASVVMDTSVDHMRRVVSAQDRYREVVPHGHYNLQ